MHLVAEDAIDDGLSEKGTDLPRTGVLLCCLAVTDDGHLHNFCHNYVSFLTKLVTKRFPIWMLTCRCQAVRGFPSCWLASMSGFSAAALHCCCCCCQGSRDSSAARGSCQAAEGSCLRRCGCLGSLCIPTDYWLTSGLNYCCCCCCCSWRTGAAGTVAGSLSELGGSERCCCCCGTQTCLDCRCQYWTKEKG